MWYESKGRIDTVSIKNLYQNEIITKTQFNLLIKMNNLGLRRLDEETACVLFKNWELV